MMIWPKCAFSYLMLNQVNMGQLKFKEVFG